MKNEVFLLRSEDLLTIYPPVEELKKILTYEKKEMVQDEEKPWIRTIRKVRKPIYRTKEKENGEVEAILTFQGIWKRVKTQLEAKGYKVTIVDMRKPFPKPLLDNASGFRFSQEQLFRDFLNANDSGLLGAPTRYGKCFGRGTMVLMADGSSKAIESIKNGDFVMGPDSLPRMVMGCVSGESNLFRVTPNYNGMSWVCNEDHILHVQRTNESKQIKWNKSGDCENITVSDWLNSTKWFRHVRKLRRVPLTFSKSDQYIDPYIYGAWLGDGHSSKISFTNAEPQIWEEISKWAATNNLIESDSFQEAGKAVTRNWVLNKGTGSTKKYTNIIKQWFCKSPKSNGIRREYLIADRFQRLELLAGLLDTDGESNSTTNCGIISKHKKLAEDIVFLCNSLGLAAVSRPCKKKSQNGTIGDYWRVCIRGDSSIIPFRVPRKVRIRKNKFNCLTVGFKVEPIGAGTYYGFVIDNPDGLFLLEDCTVVHNTTLIINTLKAYPRVCTVVTAPGRDLVRQLYDDIKLSLPRRDIVLLGAGSKKLYPSDDITVCSMDSLTKCDPAVVKLLLIDEPHAAVTDTRLPVINSFTKARRLGYGATLTGRFDNRDVLIEGLIGPVLAERTYLEAVDEGAIAPIVVILLHIKLSKEELKGYWKRERAYETFLFMSPRIAGIAKHICRTILPEDWQTLLFIKNEKQADYFIDYIGKEGTIAMAKKLTDKGRTEVMERMKSADIKRCLASDIYSQGVTFSRVRALVNLGGGGANTTTIQKPGRLAEKIAGKRCGIVFDFMFELEDGVDINRIGEANMLIFDSNKRRLAYEDKGYKVIDVYNMTELKTHFEKECL